MLKNDDDAFWLIVHYIDMILPISHFKKGTV